LRSGIISKVFPPQKSNPPLTPPRRGIKTAKNRILLKSELYYNYNFCVISKVFPPQKSNPPLTPPRRGIPTAKNRIFLKQNFIITAIFVLSQRHSPAEK
jgi:hypothetical protein